MKRRVGPRLTVLQGVVELGDPHVWTDATARLNTRFAVYEPLVRPRATGAFRPMLAERWTVSDDARVWTFRLRDGVRFHDGASLRAADVVASLDRARGPATTGEFGTSGLYRTYLGEARIKPLQGRRVRVELPMPLADLLDVLAEIPVLPEGVPQALASPPAGTGPYRPVEAVQDRLVMYAHPHYWNGPAPFAEVHWKAQPDPRLRVEAAAAREADVAVDVSAASWSRSAGARAAALRAAPSPVCVIFICNAAKGVCADRRVRQALNYALDVPALVQAVRDGVASSINGPLTPLHLGHDPETPAYPHAPNRARELLHDAGYGSGMELRLDIPTVLPNEAPQLADLAAAQYAEVGIKTHVYTFEDRRAYAEMVKTKRMHDLACFDSSPLSTYRVFREKFHSGVKGPWWQGYSNLTVDGLLDRAAATISRLLRRRCYRQAYRLLRDDAPWVFLYSPMFFTLVSGRAKYLRQDVDGVIRFR